VHQERTGQKTRRSRAFPPPTLPRSPTIFLTAPLSYDAVALHLGPCETLRRYRKLATSSWRQHGHLSPNGRPKTRATGGDLIPSPSASHHTGNQAEHGEVLARDVQYRPVTFDCEGTDTVGHALPRSTEAVTVPDCPCSLACNDGIGKAPFAVLQG